MTTACFQRRLILPLLLPLLSLLLLHQPATALSPAALSVHGGGISAATTAASAAATPINSSAESSTYSSAAAPRQSLLNWGRLRFMEHFFRRALSIAINDPDALRLAAKALSWTFWLTLSLSVIGTLGLDTKPILSLLSVSLVTVGFAAKDILTSLFAGVMLIAHKPFKRGDTVSLLGHRGVVLSVDVKYVRLRSGKAEMLLPVSLVVNAPVVVECAAGSGEGGKK